MAASIVGKIGGHQGTGGVAMKEPGGRGGIVCIVGGGNRPNPGIEIPGIAGSMAGASGRRGYTDAHCGVESGWRAAANNGGRSARGRGGIKLGRKVGLTGRGGLARSQ